MPFDLAAIAVLTKISTQKAAAILADDIAVNTSILQETEPKRRLPAVLKVMGGSPIAANHESKPLKGHSVLREKNP